jgi:hypothetical protein
MGGGKWRAAGLSRGLTTQLVRARGIARPMKSLSRNPKMFTYRGYSALARATRVRAPAAVYLSQAEAPRKAPKRWHPNAPAGNRIQVTSMAAMRSATRPLMPWCSRSTGKPTRVHGCQEQLTAGAVAGNTAWPRSNWRPSACAQCAFPMAWHSRKRQDLER